MDIKLTKLKIERGMLNSEAFLSLPHTGGAQFHSKNSSACLTTVHTDSASSTENSITFSPEAGSD